MKGENMHNQYPRIRELIESKRLSEAESLLDEVSADKRNAEWNFLMGYLHIKLDFYFEAQQFLQTACSMDKDNAEYKDMLYAFQSQTKEFYKKYNIVRKQTDIFGNEEHPINRPFGIFCDFFNDCCDISSTCCGAGDGTNVPSNRKRWQ